MGHMNHSSNAATAVTIFCPCLSKFSCKGRGIGIARCANRAGTLLQGECNACLIGTISAPWADEITA